MQILKNLYQVGGDLNGITWDGVDIGYNDCNTYVLKRPDGLIMFDCGCGDTLQQIFANMRYWGLDPADIRYCILTHAHLDHSGAGHLLKKQGVRFISSNETADAVGEGDERCCTYLYHKEFTPFIIDRTITDGEKISLLDMELKVLLLPGHTMGCTAWIFEHEKRRLVVSGDIIGTLLDGHFGWSGSIDFDREKYIKSLRRFARVDMDIMLPGHGMVYFHKPRRRVENVLSIALSEWRT
ncbi:MAG: MBL fold metallo-hydrolase [Deferribacteres bacterium]|nr:MBL fold metallo-hydrolase [candidate division KSB1 bacterium]MCB9500354.1 MBL fold metallo-hydrolase [Deferribacteres bacterium]